jgi:DNA repair protein RadC
LDIKHQVICTEIISQGSATETTMHPREIFRAVIQAGGSRFIVAHNHPSGNVEPSVDDIAVTKQLLQAAQTLAIPLLDHLIIGNGAHHSIRQSTSLWSECEQG